MTVLGKNNLFKRITALVLALLMVFTLVPLGNNVAKAEEGENTPGEYTFTVTDNTSAAVEGAEITIFKTNDVNAGYDLAEASNAVLTTDANGQCTYTVSEEELANAKDWTYTVTYQKSATDEETGEETVTQYATHRAKLGTQASISISLQLAKGLSGKVCITDENTSAAFYDVYLMQDGNIIQTTKSNSNGEFRFDSVGDGSYTIEVQTTNHTSESSVKTVTDFIGVEGKITDQGSITLIAKANTTVLTFTDATKVLAVDGTYTNVLTMNPSVDKDAEEGYCLTYTSDNESVAMVDADGQVTAKAIGTAKITATFYSATYQMSTAYYTVTVPGIKLSGTVKNTNGDALNDAKLYLVPSDVNLDTFSETLDSIKTTGFVSDGAYAFTYGTVGTTYNLIICCTGYEPQCITIDASTVDEAYEFTNDVVLAEGTYPVSGIVQASGAGTGVVGETVYLLSGSIADLAGVDLTTAACASTVTTTNGAFEFTEIAAGTYTIVIHSENYRDSLTTVTVADPGVTGQAIMLTAKEEVAVAFEQSELEILRNLGTDNQTLTNVLTVTKVADSTKIEDLKDINTSYSVEDNSVIEVDSATGKVTAINDLGEAVVTVEISSDLYKVNTDKSTFSYTVKVWELAFETTALSTTEAIEKIYGDDSFSTKAVVKGAGDEKKPVEIAYTSSNENIAKIIYVDAEGNVVEDIKNAADVQVQITGVTDDTNTDTNDDVAKISAAYGNATITYDLKVDKATTLEGFAWAWTFDDSDNPTMNYVYGGETKLICVPKIEGVNITYSSNSDIVTVDSTTGAITSINGVGSGVVITAAVDNPNYNVEPRAYTINVGQGTQTGFDWNATDLEKIEAAKDPVEYTVTKDTNGKLTQIEVTYKKGFEGFTLGALNTVETGMSYKYVVETDENNKNVVTIDEGTGVVSFLNAGTVKIQCTSTDPNGLYEQKTIEYILVIHPATQDISWKPINWQNPADLTIKVEAGEMKVEYQNGLIYDLGVDGQIKDDGLSYSFTTDQDAIEKEKRVAIVESDGKVTIQNIGDITIQYSSTLNGKYIPVSMSYKLIVEKGKQPLAWNAEDIVALKNFAKDAAGNSITSLPEVDGTIYVVYDKANNSYKLGVDENSRNKDLTYSFSVTDGDADVVTLNPDTGAVTINKVGNVTITYTATNDADTLKKYEDKSLSYKLVVVKNPQSVLDWDAETVQELKNNKLYSVVEKEVNGKNVLQSITVTYGDVTNFTLGVLDSNENVDELIRGFVSSDESVAKVDSKGNITILKEGSTDIIYTSVDKNGENGNYIDKALSYKLTVNKNPQDALDWNAETVQELKNNKLYSVVEKGVNGKNVLQSITVTYGDVTNFTLGVVDPNENVDELTRGFTSSDESVAKVDSQGNITILKEGSTDITYTSVDKNGENGNYIDKNLSYTLTVNKNPQSALDWNAETVKELKDNKLYSVVEKEINGKNVLQSIAVIYGDVKTFTIGVTGVKGEVTGTFTTNQDNIEEKEKRVAIVESNGTVIIQNSGDITIYYTSDDTDETNDNYVEKVLTYTLHVEKAQQSDFKWSNKFPDDGKEVTLTYDKTNTKYQVTTTTPNEADQANLTYKVTKGDAVTVDSTTGEVTINKHGTVTITASIQETTNYKAKSLSYNLTINKDGQTIHFAKDTYEFINGGEFASPVVIEDEEAAIGAVTYEIVEDKNGVLSGINKNTGALSFTLQPGAVTVKATKATDDRYNTASATYTLTVKEWDPLKGGVSSPYYTVTGKQEDSSTTWFTKYSTNNPILLVAGEDYALYKNEKDPVPNTTWTSSIHVSNVHEGTDNTITFYVKDTVNGYVSKQYTVNNIKADSVVPNAAIAIDDVTIWEKILSFFTFDLAGQDTPELKITSSDETSGVKNVYYYISNTTEPLESNGLIDVDALEKEADWKSYNNVVDLLSEEVAENVIYAKVVDRAGNSAYVATNGLIFDGAKPVLTPTIVTKDNNGYYNGNVEIKLDVLDAEPYSGVKEITYVVQNGDEVTDEGTLFTFKPASEGNPKQSELVSTWDSSKQNKNVIVNAADNNSDNVKVTFTVVDNAGNVAESVVDLKIDITVPVITVSYNNNAGDTTFTDGVYYNTDRTATITVTERHFDSERVKLTITNTDGTIPALSEWTKTSNGTGNGDDATHTATVTFSADGDYTFDISCTDVAENANAAVNYGESQAPTAFTIDKTAPTISVSYDNNDALNDNYYKADRTATITIQEHNFDASRVSPILTATDDGTTISNPTVSGWSSSGDTHTAYISYSSDALYTFDIEYADKAGNVIADVAEQTFYVDKTTPQVSITEIVDQSANNAEKIGFVITATDTNFDVFTPVLTAVIQTENGFTTTEIDVASIAEITNGQVYTVDNLDSDGIYSITCSAVDKAGNEYTEVSLQRADGSTYVESRAGEDTLIMFSVNRDGSTFDIDANTKDVLDRYYVQNVENDLVIYEVNTNELLSYAISLNGEELTEGTDYSVSSSGGDGQWMRYTYTVNKELFENEGEYVLVISSTDGAENNAFSDVKDANISFVVDRTAPVVTVTGMESDRSYQTESQTVTLMPTDDGGMVESLAVNKVDRDGNVEKEILSYSGDELRENLDTNGGTITFTLSEGLNQRIQVICTDASYSTDGQSNTYNQTFENVSVSASAIAIFFAGNTLLYIGGGVAGVGAVGGAVAFFIKRSKGPKAPKKDKKK